MIQYISAITFAVRSMQASVDFYSKLGFELVYGSPQARFSTMQAGEAFVNLYLTPDYMPHWWGRTIFRVENADDIYRAARARGLAPEPPRDAAWGERFFHLTDPDGHELSFAQRLRDPA